MNLQKHSRSPTVCIWIGEQVAVFGSFLLQQKPSIQLLLLLTCFFLLSLDNPYPPTGTHSFLSPQLPAFTTFLLKQHFKLVPVQQAFSKPRFYVQICHKEPNKSNTNITTSVSRPPLTAQTRTVADPNSTVTSFLKPYQPPMEGFIR